MLLTFLTILLSFVTPHLIDTQVCISFENKPVQVISLPIGTPCVEHQSVVRIQTSPIHRSHKSLSTSHQHFRHLDFQHFVHQAHSRPPKTVDDSKLQPPSHEQAFTCRHRRYNAQFSRPLESIEPTRPSEHTLHPRRYQTPIVRQRGCSHVSIWFNFPLLALCFTHIPFFISHSHSFFSLTRTRFQIPISFGSHAVQRHNHITPNSIIPSNTHTH